MSIQLKRTNSEDPDFALLVALLDEELVQRYGEVQNIYRQYNKIEHQPTVILAYNNDQPVGCGCIKPFEPATGEVKRMFVLKSQRGAGIGGAILRALEQWAIESGFQALVLETAARQPEAIHLYEKQGYHRIPNYGQYQNMPLSICMKKQLQ